MVSMAFVGFSSILDSVYTHSDCSRRSRNDVGPQYTNEGMWSRQARQEKGSNCGGGGRGTIHMYRCTPAGPTSPRIPLGGGRRVHSAQACIHMCDT